MHCPAALETLRRGFCLAAYADLCVGMAGGEIQVPVEPVCPPRDPGKAILDFLTIEKLAHSSELRSRDCDHLFTGHF
jgi:hypothetical protein